MAEAIDEMAVNADRAIRRRAIRRDIRRRAIRRREYAARPPDEQLDWTNVERIYQEMINAEQRVIEEEGKREAELRKEEIDIKDEAARSQASRCDLEATQNYLETVAVETITKLNANEEELKSVKQTSIPWYHFTVRNQQARVVESLTEGRKVLQEKLSLMIKEQTALLSRITEKDAQILELKNKLHLVELQQMQSSMKVISHSLKLENLQKAYYDSRKAFEFYRSSAESI